VASYPAAFLRLVEELSRLPGVGGRSAQRLAFFLLKSPATLSNNLAKALGELHASVRPCERCFNLSQEPLCPLCSDTRRSQTQICVVEEPADLGAIERTGEFRGLYHVLLGRLSPMEGVAPEDLKIRELIERAALGGIEEVILATNADVEGEATALYIGRLLKPLGVKVTRLGLGLPMGSDLEYADQVTVARAFSGRREL